uniref:Type-2 ice-structuring protein-like n=1 Tax=Neolamprologus brichardi TaxID=32507 RepID=A0A3Q4H4G4_NEOBR
MKLLVVAALLCGLMVLTTASDYRFNMSSGCPHGWSRFNLRCFVYVPRSMSWGQAERNCKSMGGHLASVHSSDEYRHIQKLTGDHDYKETWIGGSYEKVWLWSDGSSFHYTHWCPGEPTGGNQNCLQINYTPSKCWDDLECGVHRPSVCHETPIKTQTDV